MTFFLPDYFTLKLHNEILGDVGYWVLYEAGLRNMCVCECIIVDEETRM